MVSEFDAKDEHHVNYIFQKVYDYYEGTLMQGLTIIRECCDYSLKILLSDSMSQFLLPC